MLLEFSVSNFRSIKEKQTLSMVANPADATLPDNIFKVEDVRGVGNLHLLKSAAIYGANASGKSNICKAMEFIGEFIESSATILKPTENTGTIPFALNESHHSQPSTFEIHFIHKGIRYQYGISLNRTRVLAEQLLAYPKGQPQEWFFRMYNSKEQKYDWVFNQKHFKGEKQRLADLTRENVSFISIGAQFNHEQLSDVYEWFRKDVRFINFSELYVARSLKGFTANLGENNKSAKAQILSLLKEADFGIFGFTVDKASEDDIKFPDEIPDDVKKDILKQVKEGRLIKNIWMVHRTQDNERVYRISDDDESSGTMKFFGLLGPWLDTIENGYTLIIDEIGANMHTLLVRQLIQMMHDPKVNKKNAQLILTTHDTTLLGFPLFRRDQVWFTEKDPCGATHLYPLTDFKPRKEEALQKGYLAGRYGAIPFLGEFRFDES